MCFNIECISLALWQIKCWCSFTCKRWREIHLDRYISILRRTAITIRNNKQTWRHLQFTICSSIPLIFIKYYVDWESGICRSAKMTMTPRPSQKVKKIILLYFTLLLYCLRILSTEKLSLCAEKLWTSSDRFCTTLHIWVKVHCIVCLLNLAK